jgi:hypothetical protein
LAPPTLFESLFWIIFAMLFQQNNRNSVKDDLKKVLKESYLSLFMKLSAKERAYLLPRYP